MVRNWELLKAHNSKQNAIGNNNIINDISEGDESATAGWLRKVSWRRKAFTWTLEDA